MTKKKLYIHIGTPKTGSTALQDFMLSNYQKLTERGILYPIHKDLLRENKHVDICLHFRPEHIHEIDNLFEKIDSEANKMDCDKIVISAEDFFINILDLKKMSECFSEYEIHVVCYVRRQDLWVESRYNEKCKSKHTTNMYSSCTIQWVYENLFREYADYYTKLLDWERLVPKERLHVFEYQPSKTPIENSLLHLLSTDSKDLIPVPHSNERLNSKSLFFLQNTILPNKVINLFQVSRNLMNYSQKYPDTAEYKYQMSPKERREIIKNHQESNTQLSERYNVKLDENWTPECVDLSMKFKQYTKLTIKDRVLMIWSIIPSYVHETIQNIKSK